MESSDPPEETAAPAEDELVLPSLPSFVTSPNSQAAGRGAAGAFCLTGVPDEPPPTSSMRASELADVSEQLRKVQLKITAGLADDGDKDFEVLLALQSQSTALIAREKAARRRFLDGHNVLLEQRPKDNFISPRAPRLTKNKTDQSFKHKRHERVGTAKSRGSVLPKSQIRKERNKRNLGRLKQLEEQAGRARRQRRPQQAPEGNLDEQQQRSRQRKRKMPQRKSSVASIHGDKDGCIYRDRVVAIYQKYNPDKLDMVDKLLRDHKGREKDLLHKLEDKYGKAAPITTPKKAPDEVDYRGRIVAIYQKYNPDKLDMVDKLLRDHKGREKDLLHKLEDKYGKAAPITTEKQQVARKTPELAQGQLQLENQIPDTPSPDVLEERTAIDTDYTTGGQQSSKHTSFAQVAGEEGDEHTEEDSGENSNIKESTCEGETEIVEDETNADVVDEVEPHIVAADELSGDEEAGYTSPDEEEVVADDDAVEEGVAADDVEEETVDVEEEGTAAATAVVVEEEGAAAATAVVVEEEGAAAATAVVMEEETDVMENEGEPAAAAVDESEAAVEEEGAVVEENVAAADVGGDQSKEEFYYEGAMEDDPAEPIEEEVLGAALQELDPEPSGKLEDEYEIGRKLGEGAFAIVHAAVRRRPVAGFPSEVAVKTIDKTQIDEDDLASLDNEVTILRKLKHPNCVSMLQVFHEPDSMHLVMELVAGGELFDWVARGPLDAPSVGRVMWHLAAALQHLHCDLKIVHRDIKPENILCSEDLQHFKLTDFGAAYAIAGDDEEGLEELVGTPGYVAPEVVLGLPYNEAVDMWAIGSLLFMMFTQKLPFDHSSLDDAYPEDLTIPFEEDAVWPPLGPDVRALVSGLLHEEPAARITAVQLCEDPWIVRWKQ